MTRSVGRVYPPACVVDANVVAKLTISEEESDLADELIAAAPPNDPRARVAPAFLLLECGNILWKYARRGLLTPTDAETGLHHLAALGIEFRPDDILWSRAIELALQNDVTVYDAAYLALADLLDIPLVSADERLIRKAGGPSDRLILLASLR